MGKQWTLDENKTLGRLCGVIPVAEIMANYLPNRTEGAIRAQMWKLGLRIRNGKQRVNGNSTTSTRELLAELGNRGFSSVRSDRPTVDRTYELAELLEPIEVGIVSDTHLTSNYQQLTFLNDFYNFCQDRGIETILNCGDVTAGNGKVYRGQIYEQFIHGADATIKYVSKVYPKRKGIKTLTIAGNHDESFYKCEGVDIIDHIAKRRSDIEYLGMHGAYVNLGNIKIYLMHPSGGVPYARSYRVQKICEQFSPQNKPNILFMGHLHVANHLPMYRNIEAFNVGCFEAQTPYLKRKGLYPSLSGLVVKIYPTEKGLDGISTRWKFYYEPLEEDY